MSQIYLAWYSIFGGVGYDKHVYLVKDTDGDLSTTVDQLIVRAAAENNTLFEFAFDWFSAGNLTVQSGLESKDSADGLDNPDAALDRNGDGQPDTPEDRNYTLVDLAPAFEYLGTDSR